MPDKDRWIFILITIVMVISACKVGASTPSRDEKPEPTGSSLAILPSKTPQPPTATPEVIRREQIAFWSNRDGAWDIYLMDTDGQDQSRLSTGATYQYSPPAWSPDGLHIAFTQRINGSNSLMVMNADSTVLKQLTIDHSIIDPPVWSPDGDQIAFVSESESLSVDIFLIQTDGSGLTKLFENPETDWEASWSPDSSKLAFASYLEASWDVFIINVEGTDPKNLTIDIDPWATNPAWSPDGTQIVFHNGRAMDGEIYLLKVDGTDAINISNHPADDSFPSWSPDGKKILFRSDRDGNDEVYTVNPDGLGLLNLTNSPVDDWAPVWSPEGSQIAFVSGSGDGLEIHLMNQDGSGRIQLTSNEVKDTFPAFRP